MLKSKNASYQGTLSSPVGVIGISATDHDLLGIDYLPPEYPIIKPKTIAAKDAIEQLLCYFADPTFPFDIPFNLDVSPFQKSVLMALKQIPIGSTQSYADIAKQLQTSPRPVGNACRKNPLPIVIPCHRIISTNGMGGYSGATKGPLLDIKHWLLQHETNV